MRRKNAYDNVLHLTDYGAPYEGNFVSSLRALEAKLNGEGRAMTYVFPPRAADRPWAQEMARVKPNVHILAPGGFFSYMRQVRRLLSETQSGILHVHFIHYREKIASLLAARTCGHRVKIVVHLHNHLDLPKNFLRALPQRLYLKQAAQFVCCSASVANRLIRDGIPQKKVVVAENAIAFDRLDESIPLTHTELGLPAEAKTALIFGFDFCRKGVDLAVEAVLQLRQEQEKNVALAVVLSSRKEDAERNILRQLGASSLPDWIRLLPPRSDVGSYYRFADVFLSPSREEGFCYALVEAVYCKVSVVASAIDAQKDLRLPESAFCVPGDVKSLAGAILRQLEQTRSEGRDDALEEAKRRVVAAYSLSAWADAVALSYRNLLLRP
ncbi:MAG TPA: glycosyltransferase family 4 protein [Candidatus Cryosericum sp.]|nr:glycosyltransferase family 4 protein [Candidatus Cryosericum sp.]